MDERKSVKGTNAARDKPMSTDLSAQVQTCRVKKWRSSSFCRTTHTRSLSAFSPRKVDGTRVKDPRCAPPGFSQGPAYKSRPGLLTRSGQIGVLGSAGRSTGPQDVPSRAVSRDSQRLRHWTPDEPVDVLLIKVDRRLPLVISPASFTKQIADRHSRPLHSRSRLPLVGSHPAEGRQTSCRPLLAFLGACTSRSRFQTLTSSFSSSHRRLTSCSPFLAFL